MHKRGQWREVAWHAKPPHSLTERCVSRGAGEECGSRLSGVTSTPNEWQECLSQSITKQPAQRVLVSPNGRVGNWEAAEFLGTMLVYLPIEVGIAVCALAGWPFHRNTRTCLPPFADNRHQDPGHGWV
jgi:hypothetical protein